MTTHQFYVKEEQRLEINVCQAQAGLTSHYKKEGDYRSEQFKAILYMLAQLS